MLGREYNGYFDEVYCRHFGGAELLDAFRRGLGYAVADGVTDVNRELWEQELTITPWRETDETCFSSSEAALDCAGDSHMADDCGALTRGVPHSHTQVLIREEHLESSIGGASHGLNEALPMVYGRGRFLPVRVLFQTKYDTVNTAASRTM